MTRLGIIHTTVATVEPMKALAAEILPECEVVNWVDDSILPQLARNGGELDAVEGRLVQYARLAAQVGVEAILEACSSVGECVSAMQREVPIPIVRIDEAMVEEAVQRVRTTGFACIGVVATLPTTLNPTTRLIFAKARELGKPVEVRPMLVKGAYARLMAGDTEGHDVLLVQSLAELASSAEVVVLAQASMARVVPQLPEADRGKFLTSPRLAMERVKAILSKNGTQPRASHSGSIYADAYG